MLNLIVKNWKIWLIILLAAALRFISFPSLMPFTADESYLAYLSQTIIKDFHIIWIGWSALGFDLYLGPFWIYFISPFLMLSRGDPIILGYLSSLMGVITVFLLYWLGKTIFNEKVGLIASLLYASLPLIVFYDQKPYPPGVPLLSLILVLSLYLSQRSNKWWLVFAAAYGMVFHIHLSLILIILVAFYWAWVNRKTLNKKIIIGSLLVFILTVSPLIAFDYFHKGSNLTAPIRALKAAQTQKVKDHFLPVHLQALFSSLGRVWYLKPGGQSSDEVLPNCLNTSVSTSTQSSRIISGLSLLLLLSFLFNRKNRQDQKRRLLLLLSLAFLLPFTFLSVINPVEYYLLGFFPLFFLIIGLVIEDSNHLIKYPAYGLIVLALILGTQTILTAKGDFGLGAKKRLINKITKAVEGHSFYLAAEGDCQKVGGWRYLFAVYGQRPQKSTDDLIFGWLYPEELSDQETQYSVIISESRAEESSRPVGSYQSSIQEGGFTAYIIEN